MTIVYVITYDQLVEQRAREILAEATMAFGALRHEINRRAGQRMRHARFTAMKHREAYSKYLLKESQWTPR